MNKKIFNLLQYVLFLGLGIFLVWWSVGKISHEQWEKMKAAITHANFWLIIPVIVTLMLSHFSRALRWKILMKPLGYNPGTMNTYMAVLLGYFFNQFVPRMGEVAKCTVLARYEKVPADKLVGTIVAERAFDLVCLVVVFAITFFTQIDIIGGYAQTTINNIITDKAGGFSWTNTIITLVIIAAVIGILRFLLHRFAHIHVVQKLKQVIKNIWHGLTSIRYIKNKGWFIFHTVLIWTLYLVSIWIGMFAMKETSIYGIKESFSVLSMGSIGMIATQGGIGAYPFLVQQTMLLYGLDENVGNAFGWLLWLVQFFMILLFGALTLVLFPMLNNKKTANNTTSID
jgi:glycosyltransferase 2 family protein